LLSSPTDAQVDLRNPPGLLFHGEVSSADATTAVSATLYGTGSATAITVGATDQVVITDVVVSSGQALNYTTTVFDGADGSVGAGEVILAFSSKTAGTSTLACSSLTPHVCPPGQTPRVISTGTGQVDVVLRGYIVRN
jgi:hypothetical protein